MKRSFDGAFASRRNSLNFLRLVFALMVIASHAVPLGYFGTEALHDRTTLGTVGVLGFFAISGYLVAQSADRNRPGRYLWRRFLRIFPGFWVCLIVTAVLFGTIGWLQVHHPACGVTCYLTNNTPHYVVDNFWLKMNRPYIPGTATYQGLPLINAPLWTLFYEFLCYLLLAALSMTRLLRQRHVVLALTIATLFGEGYVVLGQHQWALSFDLDAMTTLVPVFLTGTLVYLYREVLPDSGWVALTLVIVFGVSPWLNWPGVLRALNQLCNGWNERRLACSRLGVSGFVARCSPAVPTSRSEERLFLRVLHLRLSGPTAARHVGGLASRLSHLSRLLRSRVPHRLPS